MSRKDFNAVMEEKMEEAARFASKPRLLLHCCCAPCATYSLYRLVQSFEVTAYFYNPNIEPEQEYRKRAQELERLVREADFCRDVKTEIAPFNCADFREISTGLEKEPEGGRRCIECFRLRLRETARRAKETGCDYFTTTLSISPKKDARRINLLGMEAGQEWGVSFLPADLKKKDGYLYSVRLSGEYRLHRQNYCGCLYSRQEGENSGNE